MSFTVTRNRTKRLLVSLFVVSGLFVAERDVMAASALAEAYDEASPSWEAQERKLEAEYQRLLDDVRTGNESAVAHFERARESWEMYRTEFCRSVGQAFGGAYAGVHEENCKRDLAKEFINEMQKWTW